MGVWCENQFGEEDAPDDLPTHVAFGKYGFVTIAQWRQRRSVGYPTTLHFEEETGKLSGADWTDNQGRESREGGLPSSVSFFPATGLPQELHFHVNGKPFRPEGKPDYIVFDPDGTAYNEDNEIIQCDDFHADWFKSIPEQSLIDSSKFPYYDFP